MNIISKQPQWLGLPLQTVLIKLIYVQTYMFISEFQPTG